LFAALVGDIGGSWALVSRRGRLDVMAARIRELDVTDVLLVPLDYPDQLVADRLWEIKISCGQTGGYRLIVDGLHLSDLLQDSGIREPGDVAHIRATGQVWTPTLLAKRWVSLEVDELSVFDGSADRPGAVLEVARESSSGRWRFHMGDRVWRAIVVAVAKEIEFPWFHTARAAGLALDQP